MGIPTPWNEFRNINCEDVDYGYDKKVVTQILTLNDLPEDSLKRLELMETETLYQKGLNSVKISDFSNENEILTPTYLQYDPKIVWISHDKVHKHESVGLSGLFFHQSGSEVLDRVGIYGRVSTNEQTTDNQIKFLQKIVERNEWELTGVYVDEGGLWYQGSR